MNGLVVKGVKLNLIIIKSDEAQPKEVDLETAVGTIYLGYEVGVHYRSLVPRGEVSSPAVSPIILAAKASASIESLLSFAPGRLP